MPVTLSVEGRRLRGVLPDRALPDCQSCPKPELTGLNAEAVQVWQYVYDQQQRSPMSGFWFGIRFEALVAALRWFDEAGRVSDVDAVLERIRVIDPIYCRYYNQRVEAEQKAAAQKPES